MGQLFFQCLLGLSQALGSTEPHLNGRPTRALNVWFLCTYRNHGEKHMEKQQAIHWPNQFGGECGLSGHQWFFVLGGYPKFLDVDFDGVSHLG